MVRYKYSDYSQPGFVESLFEQGLDKGKCEIVLSDTIIVSSTRVAIMNIIIWECLMKFGIHPSSKEFMNYKSITVDSIANIHSRYYLLMLQQVNTADHFELLMVIFHNIERLYNLICRYLNTYMPSIDALGLAKLCANPEVKKLIDEKIDERVGTRVAEQIINAQKKTLIGLISKPDALKNNILYPYITADTLKTNQIPQMLIKYGPRSDIDDKMCRHVINESSFSGNKSAADFGIESLSAKKSAYFNKTVIKQSQYFNRKTRLAGSLLPNLYPGWCGSTTTIPFYIRPEYAKNMIERSIMVDGNIVRLTKQNISEYVGKTVNMLSIFGCRHTDGFCERCAGYRYYPEYASALHPNGIGLTAFLPKDVHIGILCVIQLMSRVTQKILSNKHLIATNSKVYNLPENTARYLYNDGDCNIMWDSSFTKKLKNCQIRIPSDNMGQISDLILDVLPMPEAFSKISYIDIMKGDEVIDTIFMEADGFIPFLSEQMLEYMRKQYDNIEYKDNGFVVDMKEFDAKKPFMNYVIMNDDMISYVNRVKNFISTDISGFTSVSRCISTFADIVYHKSELNLFYLEVILRALNITDPNNFDIPVITDPEHVCFGRLDTVISESTISMKLAHEHLNKFLTNPRSALYPRKAGWFKEFFGLV